MLNLDTHVLVSLLVGDLSDHELRLIQGEQLIISDIVLWELAKMIQLGRLEMDLESPEFQTCLQNLTVVPITLEIAHRSTHLDFSSDPADEIIAATSIIEDIPLLTRDRKILKSRVIPFPSVS